MNAFAFIMLLPRKPLKITHRHMHSGMSLKRDEKITVCEKVVTVSSMVVKDTENKEALFF